MKMKLYLVFLVIPVVLGFQVVQVVPQYLHQFLQIQGVQLDPGGQGVQGVQGYHFFLRIQQVLVDQQVREVQLGTVQGIVLWWHVLKTNEHTCEYIGTNFIDTI